MGSMERSCHLNPKSLFLRKICKRNKLKWYYTEVDEFIGSPLTKLICKTLAPEYFLMIYYLWENSPNAKSFLWLRLVKMFGFKDYQLCIWKHLSYVLWILKNVKHQIKTQKMRVKTVNFQKFKKTLYLPR